MGDVDLQPAGYLGAAACLLISSEAGPCREFPSEDPHSFGPLGQLRPYIARRWQIEIESELPELPVPERFQRLFRDWADNKVDFVGPAQESSEGGVV